MYYGRKKKEGTATFYNGYNCAQSVLSVFAEDLGMSKDACLKLASPFGSGIAYMQETCGAVSGALMAIGLKYGRGKVEKTVDYLDQNNVN